MTPQEVQRTMDFILRSQAGAVIRMEHWEERSDEQQQKIDGLILAIREAHDAIREAAKVAHDAAKAGRDTIRSIREHERRIRSLEKSKSRITRRVDTMRDIVRILARLEAHSSKRLDQLEKH
jgi:methyl-accepting chemotaxis protein